jgi:hypothetical protein
MAIQDVVLPGAGSKVATDKIGADRLVQILKIAVGAEGVLALAAAGAGAVDAGTLRTTLASDDAAVVALASLISTVGAASDAAWDYGATGTLNAIGKAQANELVAQGLKLGELDDAQWDGTGNPASLIALWKRLANNDPVIVTPSSAEYETVAASQTDQMMGVTGAIGDTIEGILVIPASTSPGAISIEDGSTNTTVFAGGASSVTSLIPFYIPLNNIATVSGGWEITTGANVSCIVFGTFS